MIAWAAIGSGIILLVYTYFTYKLYTSSQEQIKQQKEQLGDQRQHELKKEIFFDFLNTFLLYNELIIKDNISTDLWGEGYPLSKKSFETIKEREKSMRISFEKVKCVYTSKKFLEQIKAIEDLIRLPNLILIEGSKLELIEREDIKLHMINFKNFAEKLIDLMKKNLGIKEEQPGSEVREVI